MSQSKQKKIVDIMKHVRRIQYRIKNFFQYRLMANSKHLLLVGDPGHPLFPHLEKEFGTNWEIAHMGYFNKDELPNSKLCINLTELSDSKGNVSIQAVAEIEKKISDFSKHYEAIIFMGNQVKNEESIILSDQIDQVFLNLSNYIFFPLKLLEPHQRDMTAALIASRLACKYLYTNGMLIFTVDEQSYFNKPGVEITLSPQRVMRDCELMNLGMVLGERDDMENDTLTLVLLLKDGFGDNWNKAIVKYIKLWSDTLKRPASGTFVQFKESEHKVPLIYPDIF